MLSYVSSLFGARRSSEPSTVIAVDHKASLHEIKNIERVVVSKDRTELFTARRTGEIDIWRIEIEKKQQPNLRLHKQQSVNLDLLENNVKKMQLNHEGNVILEIGDDSGSSVYKIKKNSEKNAYKIEKFFAYLEPWSMERVSSAKNQLILKSNEEGSHDRMVYTENDAQPVKEIKLTAPAGFKIIDSEVNLVGDKIIALCADEDDHIGIKTYSIIDATWDMDGQMAAIQVKEAKAVASFVENSRIFYLTPDFIVIGIQVRAGIFQDKLFSVWDLKSQCEIMQKNDFALRSLEQSYLPLPDNPNAFVVETARLTGSSFYELWLVKIDRTGIQASRIKEYNLFLSLPSCCFIDKFLFSSSQGQFFNGIAESTEHFETRQQYLHEVLLPFLISELHFLIFSYDLELFSNKPTIYLDAESTAPCAQKSDTEERALCYR